VVHELNPGAASSGADSSGASSLDASSSGASSSGRSGRGRAGGGDERDDLIQPYQIERFALRGRLVRLGAVADAILTQHDYPAPVAAILGETLALAAVLAGALKYKGVFTLQTKGDGPVSMLVADVTSEGNMRGYAQFDAARLDAALEGPVEAPVPRLLGAGYLAFTVDQGPETERYQGIVDLAGATMAECAHHYFRQSEQLETAILLSCERVKAPEGADAEGPNQEDAKPRWRAAGITLQRMPGSGGAAAEAFTEDDDEDGWRRALTLMATVRGSELLGPAPGPHDLLYRLYHEDGVRVFRPRRLVARCRCGRDRVAATLAALPRVELDDMKIDGDVVVTCQFCNADYVFDDTQLDALFAG
jgi:molecular chaperone Hsp33